MCRKVKTKSVRSLSVSRRSPPCAMDARTLQRKNNNPLSRRDRSRGHRVCPPFSARSCVSLASMSSITVMKMRIAAKD